MWIVWSIVLDELGLRFGFVFYRYFRFFWFLFVYEDNNICVLGCYEN